MAEALRKIDVIDTSPAFTQADADALNARFEGVDTLTMLETLFAEGILGKLMTLAAVGVGVEDEALGGKILEQDHAHGRASVLAGGRQTHGLRQPRLGGGGLLHPFREQGKGVGGGRDREGLLHGLKCGHAYKFVNQTDIKTP